MRLHRLYCRPRRLWLRKRHRLPLWRDDKVAVLIGYAHLGCPYCGKGAAKALRR